MTVGKGYAPLGKSKKLPEWKHDSTIVPTGNKGYKQEKKDTTSVTGTRAARKQKDVTWY